MYKARIHVTLKETVRDPQGHAVSTSLHALGYDDVISVRIGKYMEVTVDASDRKAAEQQVEGMCRRLLANPVIEDYQLEIQEVEPA